MDVATLRTSLEGRRKIKEARKKKGWTVSCEDTRPLKEASKFLLEQHAQNQGWDSNDERWVRDFDRLFRVESDREINEIKIKLFKSKQSSFLEQIIQLIDAGEIFAKNISYGTWSRFASQTKGDGIKEPAFKAYCYILGLDWQQIVASNENDVADCNRYENLPARNYTAFIGREIEMTRLLELLRVSQPVSQISVEGVGGLGKTTLVLEAAYRCLKTTDMPSFDAIIFTSAKPQYLTGKGILPRLTRERTLRDIFRTIARTLNCLDITHADFDEQIERIQESLKRQRTLLIIDNLETIEEREVVLSFLYDLPPTTKAVITSRVQTPFVSIRLDCLSPDEGFRLIQQEAGEKSVILSDREVCELYQVTNGLPAAIVYAIGQLASGYLLKNVLTRLSLSTGDIARFCFEGSIQPLREQLTHQLLMTLALFPKPASLEALVQIATPESDAVSIEESLAKLQQLSLINQQRGRYQMLPLTRSYALAELENYPNFELVARERWLNWYLQYSQEHGGRDWKEWNDYENLELEWENLQEAIEWCIAKERYTDLTQFWQQVKCYSHAQGYDRDRLTYWNNRLDWTDWLIQAASSRQDWSTAAQAMCDRGWTLTLMGQTKHLEAAEKLLARAWELREYKDKIFQVDLAINMAVLCIHKQDFERAHHWLNEGKILLREDLPTAQRQWIHILYYQGEICFRTANYEQAKIYYQEALVKARVIGWKRAFYCAQNWLADIAIELGNLEEARLLLEECLRVAEENKDKSSFAFNQQSFAFLEQASGNLSQAHQWATLARENFLKLGMLPEVEEMDLFVHNLELEACF